MLALLLGIYLLNVSLMGIPTLGKLLNPYDGFLTNENSNSLNTEIKFTEEPVQITYDERNIPHVFAENEGDMYVAQGYVTAVDRLWQIDFLSMVAAGRLAEILGDSYLEHDRLQRRYGILHSAKQSLEVIEQNPITKKALDHYTKGVNTFIDGLEQKDLPIEYKLLGYDPEPWTNLKSVLIMKYVGSTLTGYEEDINTSYMKLVLKSDFDLLYPDYKVSENPESSLSLIQLYDSLPYSDYIDYNFLGKSPAVDISQFNPRLGSNAWALADEKTKGKGAILCNDPHLNLTLPSIWYEIQLNDKQQNVYGFSIPGTPGIVVGFNDDISWGITNGAADVRDWYKLEIRQDYSAYLFDGKWLPTKKRLEVIKIKGSPDYIDTVRSTIHGPIVSDNSLNQLNSAKDCAMRWTVNESTNEFESIIRMNNAKSIDEFQEAISAFMVPTLNFLFADRKGNIGTFFRGAVWKKDQKYLGRQVLDGTRKDHLFEAFVPSDELPSIINPVSKYVYSANNNPFSADDSLYVNGYYSEMRANKIASVLAQDKVFSIDDQKRMQLDNTNRVAQLALPILLKHVNHSDREFVNSLKNWDGSYAKDSKLASFFEDWWSQIEYQTWDELVRYSRFIKNPDDVVLLNLIKSSGTNKYFDKVSTEKVETAGDIVAETFNDAYKYHQSSGEQNWGQNHRVNFIHLADIDAFGKLDVEIGGHPEALNAISENWGPSLRFIIQMGETIEAYGIIAGGPSGNPGSKYYDSNISDWLSGKYYKLHFYQHQKEGVKDAKRIIKL